MVPESGRLEPLTEATSGLAAQPSQAPLFVFDIWGCRGSRNLEPGRSRIGRRTSCYSVLGPDELVVFDAGRGIAALAIAMRQGVRFRHVARAHILLSHAHMDHWEGLKDVDWFWLKDRPLDVTLLGTAEAIEAARAAFAHPSYVPLEQLTSGSDVHFRAEAMKVGERRELGPFRLSTAPLNHYSGAGPTKRPLDTIGFRLEVENGPIVSYLSDHEPVPETAASESALMDGASLILVDAHYQNIADHAHGHGSVEHAARLARRFPEALVVAGHCGSLLSDEEIIGAVLQHAQDLPNCRVAREGDSYRWSWKERRFVTRSYSHDARAASGISNRTGVNRAEELHILRHEMRTPIDQILGYAELLQQAMDDSRETAYTDDLRKIQQAAMRLLPLVDLIRPISAQPPPTDSPAGEAVTEQATASQRAQGAAASLVPPMPSAGTGRGHLLVVDDDEDSLEMLSRRLSSAGYRISLAANGTQALEMVGRGDYDLVLLAASMQSISGLDIVKVLRRSRSKTDLPIILITSQDSRAEVAEALLGGANDYISRPVDSLVLLSRIEPHVALKRSLERGTRSSEAERK